MTQQTETQSTIPAHLAARFHHIQLPANISPKCEGAEPLCPQCGAPCAHTPQEMQGFAMDAAEEASAGLARDEEACRRANEAEAAKVDPVSMYRGSGDNVEAKTIALLTQQVSELRSAPPMSFVELDNDGTFKEWLRMLTDSSTTGKMRKAVVRSIRDLVTACAESQRSASVATLYQTAAEGKWLRIEDGLPAPYEEVRVLFNGVARIARLAHDKSYFQLATFMGSAKHQYIAKLEDVQGWQPLIAVPGIPDGPALPDPAV
jgi:hypothetical protein